MFDPKESDFASVRAWGMADDPMVAAKHFKPEQVELRWKNAYHVRAHKEYWARREAWIDQKDFDDYYKRAEKPIDKYRWEFLKLRKSWYIFPLHWDRFAREDCRRILDVGCGDGDVTQRVIDYIIAEWEKSGSEGHEIEVVGVDLNQSRLENAKNHVSPRHPKITVRFEQADIALRGLVYDDEHFDYALINGVIEVLSPEHVQYFCDEVSRVLSKGLYIEDVYDEYPGGMIRDDLMGDLFSKTDLRLVERHVVLQEPFVEQGTLCRLELWPMCRIQVLFAERSQT